MQITQSILDKAKSGFQALYNKGALAVVSHHEKLCMIVSSTGADETYGWLKDTSAFREWIGDRVIQNLSEAGFTIKNKSFENTIGVSRDSLEDDKLGMYSIRFEQLGADAKRHPDTLLFPLILSGFVNVCYDGQYFFDTDHPVVDANGVTQSVSNTGGGSGAAWFILDTSQPIKPFILQKRKDYNFVSKDKETDGNTFMRKEYLYGVDARLNVGYGLWQLAFGSKQTLDATNFEAGVVSMIGRTGDGGKPLHVTPKVLVVGPSNKGAAERIIKAKTLANGADNVNFGAVDEIIVSPYLT